MKRWTDDQAVEGLLLKFTHFYGSYDYIGDSRKWYRNEIRIIKNNKHIYSYKDAQGFRIDGRKLNVKPIDAWVYHYGWVKPPELQQAKQQSFSKLWHNDNWVNSNITSGSEFDYSRIDSLNHFKGTHPGVMKERINQKNWQFNFDPANKNFSAKARLLYILESLTGWRPFEYRNYHVI
jgi:hypothetical protein